MQSFQHMIRLHVVASPSPLHSRISIKSDLCNKWSNRLIELYSAVAFALVDAEASVAAPVV
jgi:hypothetical protein